MRQTQTDQHTRDLAAFIALSLEAIFETIDASVTAWEKRGYWLKADRFRMEWTWCESQGRKMRKAVLTEDWPSVAQSAAQVAERLKDIDVPQRHRLGEPWVGAYDKLRQG